MSVLSGKWTPKRVLHLARAEEIDALCSVLNALPHFRPSGGMSKGTDPDCYWVRFNADDWAALEELSRYACAEEPVS